MLLILLLIAQMVNPSPSSAPGAAPKKPRSEATREFLGLGTPPDAAAAERGEKLYGAHCAFCHGARANGAEGPDLVRSALVLHDEKGEMIGPVVHGGRPDKGMPAFSGFTNAQLYDVAEFLHMRVELTANRGTYQVLNVVTGIATAGEAYFKGAGGCAACHSVTGDLAHIGAKMQPVDLQQAFLYPTVPGPATAKVILPSGKVISGAVKRMDDFDVSLVDAAGDYHSYARGPGVQVQMEDKLVAHRRLLDQYTDADMHNLTAYLVTLK